MKKFPKIFVIILNYNGKNCVADTLKSVLNSNYPNAEIVLVDNGSTDDSPEMIRRNFPKIVFIKNSQNLGFAAGMNVGIRYALERGADYVLLLNYDAEISENLLLLMTEEMEKDKKIGIASSTITDMNSNIWFSGGRIDWLRIRAVHEKDKKEENYFNSDYISGCAMLIRAEVFKQTGLMDENFFLYYEDADFSLRARRAGYKLLVLPQSLVRHKEISENENEKKVYWLVLSGLIFFKKNAPFFLKPWIFVFVAARKIKNRLDMRYRATPTARLVEKAYQDFFYVV